MTDMREDDKAYGELDLVEILRTLYAKKVILLGVTLLVGLLTAGYSLTKPNIYESSAALIVRQPQEAIERNTEGEQDKQSSFLTVETLQTLTESTEITWALFGKLLEKGTFTHDGPEPLDKQAMFRGFQNSLRTELKKQQSRSSGSAVALQPVLVLKARAQSPEIAQAIANEWAALVEAKSSEMYTEGVEALSTFIGEMYSQSNDSLTKLEESLSSKTLEASLVLKEARLKSLTAKITELEDAILEIDITMAVNEVAIEEGERRILEQQVDDEWIGTVAEDALLKNEPYPFPQEDLTLQAIKVLDLSQQKVRQTEALRAFRREKNLLAKEKRFAHVQLDLERILAERAKVEDELPAVETALEALTAQLEDIPETISLDKAITDDALWTLHINEGKVATEGLNPLKTEVLNPLYQSTRKTMVDLTATAETLRGSAIQLEHSEEQANLLAQELESEIDLITEELERRQTALDATQTSISLLREDFLEETKLVEELRLKNIRSKAERATRDRLREELVAEAQDLEEDMSVFTLAIEGLTRESEKTRNVRTALASKAEEVALLQVSIENATRTGTTILYNAQANPQKIAPSRSKLILGAMVATLFACAFMLCSAKLLREAR